MLVRHINMFIATTCVSFTLIVVLFSALSIFIAYIGPTTPEAVLLLLSMCVIIAACATWLASRELHSMLVFYLLCYVACVSTVLGLGFVTGFIPLDKTNASMNWTILAMITAVFLGTALFRVTWEENAAKRINARLQILREEPLPAEPARGAVRTNQMLFSRFLYAAVTSYTALITIIALGDLWWKGLAMCNTVFALTGFGVCMAVSAAVVALEHRSSSPWMVFAVSTVMGAGLSDALLMPAGLIEASIAGALYSAAVSGIVSCFTAGALWLLDELEAQDINERIRERREDGK